MCHQGIVQHQEKADGQTDFPSERMPWCQVHCSASPHPGQPPEALNLNIGWGTEMARLSCKNRSGSWGFPVPLSSLCPSVLLLIAIIISSKRKWAVFAKKRQNNSRLCQIKESPPTSWWLFFNKGLFLLKGGKMCVIVKCHTCTPLINIGIHVAYDLLALWQFCSREKYVSLTQYVFLECNAYISITVSYSITTAKLVSAFPLQLTLFRAVWMKQDV